MSYLLSNLSFEPIAFCRPRIYYIVSVCVCVCAVSYTHLDVYKRQSMISLRPEQTILSSILTADNDDEYSSSSQT